MTSSSTDSKKFANKLADIRNQELKSSDELKLDELVKKRAEQS